MATPAAGGVEFDRNRLSQGELIAGIAGLVLLIDLWFKWYGVKVSGGSGLLKGFSIGVSANAWESFGGIDILLFLVALIAIGVAVLRAMARLPEMPFTVGQLLTVAGGIALVLILFRTISPPIDTHGVNGIDVTRKIGLWIGLLSAIALTYGGWRTMSDEGTSLSTGGLGGGGSTAPTTPMAPAGGEPGVPGGGAAGVSPGKEGPGAPHPGTSTGGPGDGDATPPAASSDPVPGETGSQTPPGLAGEPPSETGTTPPGI